MAYELTGKVKLIQDLQTFNSGFTKREMVVTVEEGNYPQDINIEFVKDKVSLLDAMQVGQQVTVTFDIRGREYNGRYFNNLVGWKIQNASNEGADPYDQTPMYDNTYGTSTAADYDDEVPF